MEVSQPLLAAVYVKVIVVDEPLPETVPVTVVLPRTELLIRTGTVDSPLASLAPVILQVTVCGVGDAVRAYFVGLNAGRGHRSAPGATDALAAAAKKRVDVTMAIDVTIVADHGPSLLFMNSPFGWQFEDDRSPARP